MTEKDTPSSNPSGGLRLLLARIDLTAGLSSLPVVGPQVPKDLDVRVTGLRFGVANRLLVLADVQKVNALLGAGGQSSRLRLPDARWTGKTQLGLSVELGGRPLQLNTPDGSGPPPAEKGSEKTKQAESGQNAMSDATGQGGQAGQSGQQGTAGITGTAWYSVDRTLGPVRLDRLGVRYTDNTVWLVTDAGLDIGGLKLSGRGMALGIPLENPAKVVPRLEGLGIGFSRPPVEISGAFLNQERKGYLVSLLGAAVLKLPTLSLSAVGGYAQREHQQPSLFVFGQLAFAEGQGVGPPPFRVTGAAAGFGYNSSVRVPDITEVDAFPLMPGGAGDADTTDAMALLDTLISGKAGKDSKNGKDGKDSKNPQENTKGSKTGTGGWIREAPGRIWLAAGVRFDSFQFVHSRALALGDFGFEGEKNFTLALLGRSAADFPLRSTGASRYAHVELSIKASYESAEDALKVAARIEPGSYLVHPSCKLSGDAAFSMWFGNNRQHAGDFVLTAGGYHPKYPVPSHYPKADRLKLEWSWGPVSLRGACYAALTPSAFMVGAELDVSFHASPISAWCRAALDALIQWDPFSFRVTVSVSIGVRIDIAIPISMEIGVDLDLWGPPTGGIARVHVIAGWNFEIRFGEDPPSSPAWLPWKDFTDRMLPGPVAQISAEKGRLPARPVSGVGGSSKKSGEPETWEMSPDGFTVLTRTTVPAQQVRLVDVQGKDRAPSGSTDGSTLSVRPVGATGARSTHRITVQRDGKPFDPEADGWTVDLVRGNVPLGLWGVPLKAAGTAPPDPGPGNETIYRVTGTRITAHRPAPSADPLVTSELQVGHETVGHPQVPLTAGKPDGTAPACPGTTRADLAAHLATDRTKRAELAQALADDLVAPPGARTLTDDLPAYARTLWSQLRTDPMQLDSAKD
ncbi:DUF6603 domain-containing protein [Streptomyces sp. URMC 127]|uniref:DUF6603 domain-containing protein n=1 Tax=Streptomyces sp. URMC 127 TaxID=3423402 RepID=UPI003F1AA32A